MANLDVHQGTGNVALFSEDHNGTPLSFYVSNVESRPQIIILIQERGGEVLERVTPVDPEIEVVCVVGDKLRVPLTIPEGMKAVRRQFIIDCIDQNKLLSFADYAPNQGDRMIMAIPTDPLGRNDYTDLEDEALVDAVLEAMALGYEEHGMKLYRLIAPQFPRHTVQSLRDRYLNTLLPKQEAKPKIPPPELIHSDPVPPTLAILLSSSPRKLLTDQAEVKTTAEFTPLTQAFTIDEPQSSSSDHHHHHHHQRKGQPVLVEQPAMVEASIESDEKDQLIQSTIRWMTERCKQSREVVLFALYQCNGDVKEAIKFITTPTYDIKWDYEDDICLIESNNSKKINQLIMRHGSVEVKNRQAFLRDVCS